jgi:hypothetical protein
MRNVSPTTRAHDVVSSAKGQSLSFAFTLTSTIMSKQKKNDREGQIYEDDQVIDRCIFAMLVVMVANQTLDDFLKDKSDEERNYYGDVWDRHRNVPIGVLFNRPKFEQS